MEIRPYIKVPELKIGDVIATGELTLDVQKPTIDPATVRLSAVQPHNGLQVSKEAFDTSKIKALKAKEQEDVFKDITSIVVLKNNKILIEEYFNNAGRNTLHDVRSVGKTFAQPSRGLPLEMAILKAKSRN